jgi:hypothetical protein
MFQSQDHYNKATKAVYDALRCDPSMRLNAFRALLAKHSDKGSIGALQGHFNGIENANLLADTVFAPKTTLPAVNDFTRTVLGQLLALGKLSQSPSSTFTLNFILDMDKLGFIMWNNDDYSDLEAEYLYTGCNETERHTFNIQLSIDWDTSNTVSIQIGTNTGDGFNSAFEVHNIEQKTNLREAVLNTYHNDFMKMLPDNTFTPLIEKYPDAFESMLQGLDKLTQLLLTDVSETQIKEIYQSHLSLCKGHVYSATKLSSVSNDPTGFFIDDSLCDWHDISVSKLVMHLEQAGDIMAALEGHPHGSDFAEHVVGQLMEDINRHFAK